MKYLFCLLSFLFITQEIAAQLLTPYTLYRDQWGVVNPASVSNNYTVDEYTFSIAATDRHQWLGNGFNWDYSPNTQVLNFEGVLEDDNIIVGGHIVADRTGALSTLGAYGRFAYMIPLDRLGRQVLSIGLSLGLIQTRSRIDGFDSNYFDVPEEDIVAGAVWNPDVSLGMFYFNEDIWYAGISMPQVLSFSAEFGEDQLVYSLRQPRHYYAVAGGYIPFDLFGFGDGSSYLELSGWARYLPLRQSKADSFAHLFRIDGNARYQHNQVAWVGFGMGTALALDYTFLHTEMGFIAGENLNLENSQLKIGVALDFTVGDPLQRLGPSAEINIMFSWY